MRLVVACVAGTLALSGVAQAQAPGSGASTGYVEGVAQSAFGNVTSQSYGAEGGFNVMPTLQIFVEGGQTRNVATSQIGAAAQLIAAFLTRTQTGAVGYTVKEPVTFGAAGVKYLIPMSGKAQPYVLGGFGIAKFKQDVTFSIGGADVTGNLQQYGVVLGTDLSGDFTKAMLVLGGGVGWPLGRLFIVDFQYRFGRIFAEDQGINVNRAGVGLGVRF